MYIFDEVVAVGFNTLCYGTERRRKMSGIKPSVRIKKKGFRVYKNPVSRKFHLFFRIMEILNSKFLKVHPG